MAIEQITEKSNQGEKSKKIKCIVWDLDHTLWDGILLEDGDVSLKPGVVDIIKALDARGILHSIASRNDITADNVPTWRSPELGSRHSYFSDLSVE